MNSANTDETRIPAVISSSSLVDNSNATSITVNNQQQSGDAQVAYQKPETPRQISALLNFIRTSIRSNKKKDETNMSAVVVSQNSMTKTSPEPAGEFGHDSNSVLKCSDTKSSFVSSNDIFCRFCQEYHPENELVSPCLCSGTLKYIHQSCLQRWIKAQDNRFCELCKYEFHMKITTKPFREWQKLEMNVMERRKIICSVTFHIIALTCVIWSLYVLIERTTEEMRNRSLEWPFWTKLIVVAIGFVGGIVFMYVQCRMYVALCRKWHDYNRTFVVQGISEAEIKAAQAKQRLAAQKHLKPPITASHATTGINDRNEAGDICPTNPEPMISSNPKMTSTDFEECYSPDVVNVPYRSMSSVAPLVNLNNRELTITSSSLSSSEENRGFEEDIDINNHQKIKGDVEL